MQVLVGNEPRAYREVLAAAIAVLRPYVQVRTVEPIDLDRAVLAAQSSVVFCSRLSLVIEARAASWILLYPDGEGRTIVGARGRRFAPADMDLDAILHVIDQAEMCTGDCQAAFG